MTQRPGLLILPPFSQYFLAGRGAVDGGVVSHGRFFERAARRPSPSTNSKVPGGASCSLRRPPQLLRSFPTFTLRGHGSSGQVGPGAGGPREWLSPLGGRCPRPRAAPFVTVLTGVNTHGQSPGCFPRLLAGTCRRAQGCPCRRPSLGAWHHRAAASVQPPAGPDRGHGASRAGSIPSPRPGGLQPLRTPRRHGFIKRERPVVRRRSCIIVTRTGSTSSCGC